MENKTVAIIQARLTSTRFPQKILEKINNLTLIEFLVKRVKASKKVDQVIVAIPNNKENRILKKYLKNVDFFLGSEEDVLDRYYKSAKKFNANTVVRICGDCPFVDSKIIDKLLSILENKNYDYVSNTINPTFPDGLDVEVFNFKILKEVWEKSNLKNDREHVTPYILRNNRFKKYNYEFKKDLSSLRLTIDERIDLKQLIAVYSHLKKIKNFGINDILKLYMKNKKLFSVNSFVKRNEGSKINLGQNNIF